MKSYHTFQKIDDVQLKIKSKNKFIYTSIYLGKESDIENYKEMIQVLQIHYEEKRLTTIIKKLIEEKYNSIKT